MSTAAPGARGGRDAVKTALVDAAAAMLSEVGPRALTVRDVARRAGVNHGQVHHCFGGKRGLLEAAMRQLARGHYEHARELTGDALYPPALSLAEDSSYWRAVCRVVIEGDLDLARIEIDEGISVPRNVLRSLQQALEIEPDDLDFKARVAAMAALTLGWVAFEDFMLLVADVEPEQREALRSRVKQLIQDATEQALG
ncbi:MAG: TetR/AcrR family transcriptional regulator [Myxococcota bacterium]|nr:TetR/AcrR family transcriptional regulator [Myxococcota bacterium]